MQIVSRVYIPILITAMLFSASCSTNRSTVGTNIDIITLNDGGEGPSFEINLENGKSHNHPTFAIWVEDMDENFIQTIFVTKSIATGIFGHGPLEAEKWDTKPGQQKRPAALPYWTNRRKPLNNGPQLPDPEHPVPDAYTGATPQADARIQTILDNSLDGKIRILLEVNQPWDWNDYWTNKLYDDPDYRTSCQPSLIYAVSIDVDQGGKEYHLNPIGHGHYSGKNGDLQTNLSTISTAKDIFRSLKIQIK